MSIFARHFKDKAQQQIIIWTNVYTIRNKINLNIY